MIWLYRDAVVVNGDADVVNIGAGMLLWVTIMRSGGALVRDNSAKGVDKSATCATPMAT